MATSPLITNPSPVVNTPLLQKRSTTYRSIAGKALKQGQTLVDFSVTSDAVIRLHAEPGMSYSLTDPVTGKVIEPKKVQQLQRALEITLPDGRQVVLDDFFTTVLNAEGVPLIQAQAEFVFFTGPGATPYWVVDRLSNLAEWTLEAGTQIWPSQDLLGVPQWMSTQGLSASALIVPSSIAVGSSGLGGLGAVLGALGGLGLAGGGGGGGVPPAPPPVLSASNKIVNENIPLSTVVFTTVSKPDPSSLSVVYSLKDSDFSLFSINPNTGDVTFRAIPDADLPRDIGGDNIYTFTVVATDSLKRTVTQAVTITVVDLPDQAPIFTSPSARSIAENSSASTILLTANARPDITSKKITFNLEGVDKSLFDLNPATGELRFKSSPNHEAPGDIASSASVAGNNIYDLVIIASEEGNSNTARQNVTITVTDLPDTPPVFSGGNSASRSVAENVSTATPVHTVLATPDVFGNAIRYTLGGVDAAKFNINANGQVTFKNVPDFELPSDLGSNNVYDLVVNAIETANGVDTSNQSSQNVTINVTNVSDVLTFTSPVAVSVNENSLNTGYTAQAVVDSQSVTYTYSLGVGGDEGLFNLNATTGVLSFKNAPDFENPADAGLNNIYDVHIVATSTQIDVNGGSLVKTASQTVLITVNDVGVQPVPTTALSAVQNLDVQSNLVINFASAVNLVGGAAAKKIRIVCDSNNSRGFELDLNDTSQVTLSADGKNLVINPRGDLDFGSNYHIEVDAGAFISRADPSGTAASAAFSNLAAFKTVVASSAGDASQKMTDTGGLIASQTYMNIAGRGDINTVDSSIDMGMGNITLVYQDSNAAGGTPTTTGIGTGSLGFNLQVKNWAFGDFLYFDDLAASPNTVSANKTESYGGLQEGNTFNKSATQATQVPNFVGLLQIDPGGVGMPHAWIGIGVATPGYGGLDGAAFKNSVISG